MVTLALQYNRSGADGADAFLRALARKSAVLAMIIAVTALGLLAAALTDAFYPSQGKDTVSGGNVTIDKSHMSDGYLLIKHQATSKDLRVRISKGSTALTYKLNGDGEYEVFPLQLGDGTYTVTVYISAGSNRYAAKLSKKMKVKLNDELSPYLCPNQYVWYRENSETVRLAQTLCVDKTDAEKLEAVCGYVSTHVTYDFFKAMSVKKDYLPVPDETLKTGQGICFDYAVLACAMLRSQGVPCRLEIGYADKTYHAWISAYIDDEWRRNDPTYTSTGAKAETYTLERWY